MLFIFLVDSAFACVIIRSRLIGTTEEQHYNADVRTHPQSHFKSVAGQARLVGNLPASGPARSHHRKPGRRVRRRLGTKEEKIAGRLVAELNELLADRLFWQPSSRATALTRFSPLVVDIFYHDMAPDTLDPFVIREIAMPLARSAESDYRQVLLLGATGGGKSTLVRQLIGTDPRSERFPSTSTARTWQD